MPSYSENDLNSAIQAVNSGRSLRKAADDWGIPKSTLHHYLKVGETRTVAHEHQQRLSSVEEDNLAQWILMQGALGLAPTHGQIRVMAQNILSAGGDETRLGKKWITHFIGRNPSLKTLRAKRIEYSRVNGASKKNISKFFDRLQHPEVATAIKPENRWNMDEAGIMEGFGLNGLVVGNSERKSIYVKSPQSRNWTSMIECISASGGHIKPLIIFKGASVQEQWIPEELKCELSGWKFVCSQNGWTKNEIAQQWLEKVFIPQTQSNEPNDKRLLMLDGHASHVTENFMYTCYQNNIYLLFLPSHTSHVLQPLDLGVFSSLKAAYRRHLGDYVLITDSSPLGKRNFLSCYFKARQDSFTTRNIRAGWKATGTWSVNINKPLESRQMLPEQSDIQDTLPSANNSELRGISTPKGGSDVIKLAREAGLTITPERRLLFRKIGKGLDRQISIAVHATESKRALEQKLDNMQPRKRRRVVPDPNELFVSVPVERERQEAYTATHNIEDDAATIAGLSFEEMCFEFSV